MGYKPVVQAFFSYAHDDEKVLSGLHDLFVNRLQVLVRAQFPQLEFRIWSDAKIRTGDRWDPAIESAIRASQIFLVPLSGYWLRSENCLRELATFRSVEPELPEHKTCVLGVQFSEIRETPPLLPAQSEAYADLKARQFCSGPAKKYLSRLNSTEQAALLEKLADDVCGLIERIQKTPDALLNRPSGRNKETAKRPREFDASAQDFAEIDFVEPVLQLRRVGDRHAVLAQSPFIDLLYIESPKAGRIEFGVHRAYLDVWTESGHELEKSDRLRNLNGRNFYVPRHEPVPGSITIELIPEPGKATLGDVTPANSSSWS